MRQTTLPWATTPVATHAKPKWHSEFPFVFSKLQSLEKVVSSRKKCSFKKFGDACSCRKYGEPKHSQDNIKLESMFIESDPIISEATDPSKFLQKRVLIWAPDIYFALVMPHIICSVCQCRMRSNGWNEHGPQRVYAMGSDYYVLSKQYICSNGQCEKKMIGKC